MVRKKKDEPSNKDRLVRFLVENEASKWSLKDMAEALWSDSTPGLVKMASGVFTGARRTLLDNGDNPRLIIPVEWEGRKAVLWKFADSALVQDKAFVLTTMIRKEHTAVGWGNSLTKSLDAAKRANLISPEEASKIQIAFDQQSRA